MNTILPLDEPRSRRRQSAQPVLGVRRQSQRRLAVGGYAGSWLAALACTAVLLTGCLSLKPRVDAAQYFLLAPLPPPVTNAVQGGSADLIVGVGPVPLPGYLRRSSLAIRTGDNEVRYDDLRQWAERLEEGIPRVLARDLDLLLPAGQVRTAAWRRGEVTCELYVSVERFDVDEAGRGQLVADWRITSPGAERVLKHGQAGISRAGPAPGPDPAGAVATLSQSLGELARQLAEELVAVPHPPGK